MQLDGLRLDLDDLDECLDRLSGCSLSRKFRPLKYDRGNARDSETRCLMSMRAASQPSAKKSGNASNHQYSISIACATDP